MAAADPMPPSVPYLGVRRVAGALAGRLDPAHADHQHARIRKLLTLPADFVLHPSGTRLELASANRAQMPSRSCGLWA
jgi:hypothetical protein